MVCEPTKTKLLLLMANAFPTATLIVNNNDAIYFLILLLYLFVFPMLKLKSLGSMYMLMPTEKSTFDNACSNTP